MYVFFFSSRRRHTRFDCDWSSDVCSSDLNSNGGAISILTARPALEEFHARASIGGGNYDQLDTELMVNVPVNDSIALRARSEERRVGKECRCGGWEYRERE